MSILDEFEFINSITPRKINQQDLVLGIGDDGALINVKENETQVVCVDTMVEGVHFKRETMSAIQIGYKALAINISDVAAMGGLPLYYLVSIAIPKTWNKGEMQDLYKGMEELASFYHMDLIGGDTVSTTERLVITVTVLGKVKKDKYLYRKNAKPDDIVFVTGSVGDSAAGLELLLNHGRTYPFRAIEGTLVHKHQYPRPRVEAGNLLTMVDRVALNDVSDGLASELHEIAHASQVSILLDKDKIPLSAEILACFGIEKSLEYGLFGGEDFELVGTTSEDSWLRIKEACEKLNINVTEIGKVVSNRDVGVFQNNPAGKPIEIKKLGYNHFKRTT